MNNTAKSEILKHLYKNKMYQLVTNDTILDYYKNEDKYDILMMIKYYGCSSLKDFLDVCEIKMESYFDFTSKDFIKWNILVSSFQMLTYSFKNIHIKLLSQLPINKENNLYILPYSMNIENNYKYLFLQTNGIKCILYNKIKKKIFLLEGYIENNSIITHSYKNTKIKDFIHINNNVLFTVFLNLLPFTFYLIHDDYNDYFIEFTKYLSFIKKVSNQGIEEIISHFLNLSTYHKKIWIFYLLIDETNIFCANLAVKLFYTLHTNTPYNTEQISILNVLPISLQNIFKENIIQFHYIPKVENNMLSLEDKIKLIKIDSIKEKAYVKYNELLLKNDESYTKTKTFLDGLLSIPFGIYKKEPILNIMDSIKNDMIFFEDKKRSNLQIYNELNTLSTLQHFEYNEKLLSSYLDELLKNTLLQIHLFLSDEKKKNKKEIVQSIIFHLKNITHEKLFDLNNKFNINLNKFIIKDNISVITKAQEIKTKITQIPLYMKNIKNTLDNIIYGQEEAKTHLQMIFSQWINGIQEGYCFGFEGLPGIGKTTLGKGIAQCLIDEQNNSRPFHIIQIGGSSNGSILYGHNYTYVSSTWGNLVQILMDSKIMNPIIFIDEVDKISKTENGKEIINTLIHLLDSTQNNAFQDKYFAGIPLDFSKVLFILSYNEANQLDKVLLDRIHRIKFHSLKLHEKIEVSKKFLLPKIYSDMGLTDCIYISDEIIEYIIDCYTNEPGVRKLKEIFFELVGYINLKYLKELQHSYVSLPICITKEEIENEFFKNKNKIIIQKINTVPSIGKVYGLWVTNDGNSGILPIQISFFASKTMNELKLTGMQGDVMKESMNVSLSLVLNLITIERKDCVETNGIHIHCPEGSIQKNGPSAGLAITCALYGLLTNQIISPFIAMTGEITLDGTILPIGGLENKIIGGIKAGVNTFLYPKDNEMDVKDKKENITYLSFSHIKDVLIYLSIL